MPWGISHKYKFIFVHIPKTAGTTICSSWEGSPLKHICRDDGILGGGHKTALQLREEYPYEWENYLTFSVVRNPFDRFVSKFFFAHLKPKESFSMEWPDKDAAGMMPQLYWLTDGDAIYRPTYDRPELHHGEIIVDRLLRYENLNDELYALFRELGIACDINVLPHFRTTCYRESFKAYYTQELRSVVAFLYRDDLERLNYQWSGADPEIGFVTQKAFAETYVRDKMMQCPNCNHIFPLDDPAFGDHFFMSGEIVSCHSCGYQWNDNQG